MSEKEPSLIPASTIVLVRELPEKLVQEDDNRIEVLLLRRNAKLDFAGGNWVFPGGRIDQGDFDQMEALGGVSTVFAERLNRSEDTADFLSQHLARYLDEVDFSERDYAASLMAAGRETMEETALAMDASDLVDISHWIAPPLMKKRFTTWFFLGAIDFEASQQVEVDGGEIHEAKWLSAAAALTLAKQQKMNLLPPTLVTLNELAKFNNVASLRGYYLSRPPLVFRPHVFMGEKGTPTEGSFVFMYRGDAGYESYDPTLEGERHRLEMVNGHWDYQNTVYV